MVEHFFMSENAIYKNDIILLLNSMNINSIIQTGISMRDWFLKEFKFASISDMITFFKKNPKKKEGRFVIIIDGIDEQLSKGEYFT